MGYLDRQVAEKQARKEAEKAAEKMYANQLDQIKDILEQRNMTDIEGKAEEAFRYRAAWDVQVQQATERSTFDLNNPNELKERPRWTDDDDVRPSSLRRFAGEDRNAGDRKKMQAA